MVQSSHLCLAAAKLLHGDDAGAMAKLQEARNYYDLSNVHHGMGNVHAARGEYPQALAEYQKAIDNSPPRPAH